MKEPQGTPGLDTCNDQQRGKRDYAKGHQQQQPAVAPEVLRATGACSSCSRTAPPPGSRCPAEAVAEARPSSASW